MPRKTKDAPDKLKPFLFHGVDLNTSSKQAEGDCPFCGKEDHFFVKTATGQWSCRRCEESGNIVSFLKQLHSYALKQTTDEDYKELSAERDIPVSTLKEWGVARSFLNEEWLIPAYNDKGKFANLYKAYKYNGQWKVMASPTCKLHPFGVQHLKKRRKTVWVVEGLWDALKLHAVLKTVKRNGNKIIRTKNCKTSMAMTEDVLGVPGSNTFNPDWLQYLENKRAQLVFDNDHPKKNKATGKVTKPGWDGMQRVIKIVRETGCFPESLYRIRWGRQGYTKDYASGYDTRDILTDLGPVKGVLAILDKSEKVKIAKKKSMAGTVVDTQPELEPIPRSSFSALVKDYEANLHFTPQLRDTLAVMLACCISTELDGDQLWLRIIGPPGSGKSTLAEAISASKDYTLPVSNITGFHSGFVGNGQPRKKQKDASLIPMMNGRTVIIKDGDTLLTATNRDKILAEMRDIYDGTSRAIYRNNAAKAYDSIYTTFIICGTDEMRSLNRSFLGERFLDCEILGDADTTPYLDRALGNTYSKVLRGLAQPEDHEAHTPNQMEFLKRCTIGYLHYLKLNLSEMKPPTLSPEAGERIKALGQFLGHMRARVKREGTDMVMRPRAELATRLVSQLTKAAICIALVRGKKSIDKDVLRMLKKLVLDTAESFQLEVVNYMMKKPEGLSVKQLELKLKISEGTLRKIMRDMQEFGIVDKLSVPNRSGVRGRNRHVWVLTDSMTALHNHAIKGRTP